MSNPPLVRALSLAPVEEGDDQRLPASQVRIAFVCTANRARSPFAAAALRRRLGRRRVQVESYGILEQRGAPALASAMRAARAFGIDLSEHSARVLSNGALEDVGLAVGFEQPHVAAAIAIGGASPERTFMLTELASVLEVDVLPWPAGSETFESRVAHASARRFAGGRLPRPVQDPAGGPEEGFRRTYDEIDRLVGVIGMRLFDASAIGAS